jgi:hypothetical protein
MIEFQPHYEEKLRILDRHVDAQGKTTLNIPEYMKFRRQQAELAWPK